MIHTYETKGRRLVQSPDAGIGDETAWIDLVEPSEEEVSAVEAVLGIDLPSRAETREIEASSRLYRENGAAYMTAFILYNIEAEVPSGATLTFVLSGNRLATIRYHQPRAFPIYVGKASKGEVECGSAPDVLVGLIETIVDRAADLIERTQDRVETVAHDIFSTRQDTRSYSKRLAVTLRGVGRQGDVTARLEESLFSLERLLSYLNTVLRERGEPQALHLRVEDAQRDVRSLVEQMRFLTDRITFLLDATLGAISIEQNQTMKVFSVLAVTLMPPTLVGSIYGMNFKHMPELEWTYGYPLALVVLVLSGLLPFLYFRRRGWL